LSDRTDIDALMMGSLYGELDAREAARLEAHLEAHPQDRAELASLRRTREVMRELPLLEPSAALTAKLMHEAARQAPRKAVAVPLAEEGGGIGAWLGRIFRPVLLHPAMAGAATLLLVGGVAGTLYLRGERAAMPRVASSQPAPAAEPAPESGAVAHWGGNLEEAPAPEAPTSTAAVASGEADKGRYADGYKVDLDGKDQGAERAYRLADDRKAAEQAAAGQRADKLRRVAGKEAAAPLVANAISGTDPLLDGSEGAAGDMANQPVPPATATKKQSSGLRGRAGEAVIVDVPAPAPMEADVTAKAKSEAPSKPTAPRPATVGGSAAGAAGTGTGTAAPKAPTTAATTAPAASGPAASGPAGGTSYSPPKQAARDEAKGEAAEDSGNLSWARMQHGKLTAAIKAKKCREAAQLANDLLDRNPDYYLSTVAGSKEVKSCQYYVDAEAKRRAAESHKSRTRAAPANVDAARAQ
jgi:hypothetical protein